jgi:hypothetical protein
MDFLLEITRQKSPDFWFADFFLEILKIHRLVWIGWIFVVSSMFVKLESHTNLKFDKRCFIKDHI